MKNSEDLRRMLRAVDHKSYPAYKDLRGAYSFGNFVLGIDHVQGDPFASPSRLSVQIDGAKAAFPPAYYKEKHCRIALQDYLNRLFYQEIEKYTFKAKGSGKSGLIAVSPSPSVRRTASFLYVFPWAFPQTAGPSTPPSWSAFSLSSFRPASQLYCFTAGFLPQRYSPSSIWQRINNSSALSWSRWDCVLSWRTAPSCPGSPAYRIAP